MRRALTIALIALSFANLAAGEPGANSSPEGAVSMNSAARGLGKSPHGDPNGCLACHAPGAKAGAVGDPLPVVATCRGCHPTADMHPVGVAPTSAIVPPSGWPLENGKVVCSTCHGEPAHGGAEANLTPPYHRGGPYADIRNLCYTCHQRAVLTRSNPHHPEKARLATSPSCAACHASLPVTGASPEDAKLRVAPREACVTCHPGNVHLGATEHLDKTVPDEMRRKLPATMALPADGRIQCWTCHEVHGDGPAPTTDAPSKVASGLRATWPAGEQVAWPWNPAPAGHDAMLAVPRDQLCRACHGDGP